MTGCRAPQASRPSEPKLSGHAGLLNPVANEFLDTDWSFLCPDFPLFAEPQRVAELRPRLIKLRPGMSEEDVQRIISLEDKAELIHGGCSHSWFNSYTPTKGYNLSVWFTAVGGFEAARLRRPDGKEEVWPK
jgi:hypothetical protein